MLSGARATWRRWRAFPSAPRAAPRSRRRWRSGRAGRTKASASSWSCPTSPKGTSRRRCSRAWIKSGASPRRSPSIDLEVAVLQRDLAVPELVEVDAVAVERLAGRVDAGDAERAEQLVAGFVARAMDARLGVARLAMHLALVGE